MGSKAPGPGKQDNLPPGAFYHCEYGKKDTRPSPRPVTEPTDQDLAALRWAYWRLEHPSFAARLSSVVGAPIERGLGLLPKGVSGYIHAGVEFAIRRALDAAVASMGRVPPRPAHHTLHRLMVLGTGAVGGFLGPAALAAELPVTTILMLRSIADIAHSQGEDPSTLETRLACPEVFALGARTRQDEAADTGYYGPCGSPWASTFRSSSTTTAPTSPRPST